MNQMNCIHDYNDYNDYNDYMQSPCFLPNPWMFWNTRQNGLILI